MPTVSVNLSTTEYVQVNTNLNPILLQAHRDAVRVTLSDVKPAKSNSVFHVVGRDDPILQFNSIDANVWALATTETSSLIASETDAVKVGVHDGLGNPIGSSHGSMGVFNTIQQIQQRDTLDVLREMLTELRLINLYNSLDRGEDLRREVE